jgi:hypothetical protein
MTINSFLICTILCSSSGDVESDKIKCSKRMIGLFDLNKCSILNLGNLNPKGKSCLVQ